MNTKYAIGVDYGTESGRAVLVSLETGKEIADHVTPYRHGVIDKVLPDTDILLEDEWALQHPQDYVEVLANSIPKVLQKSGVDAEQVIGLGIDFTACTMLPIDKEGRPLSDDPELKDNPHSWVKLWKHHAAQDEANRLNEIAEQRGEKFLPRYGGRISSEWMMAKIWQILNEAPDIYDKADRFVEATDWVTSQLTGNLVRNSCTAGYKSIWHKQDGYPSKDFFQALDPRLENLIETKLWGDVVPLGTKAGELTEAMAQATGLKAGTAVAVGNVDAHVSVPAMGVTEPGKLVMTMGTSICSLLLGDKEVEVEGMCGVVEDGIIPGLYGYEAGQPAVGDLFAWFVDNAVSASIENEAEQAGLNKHQLLEQKAAVYAPGETGLVALDWWNGNRSVLVDTDLSGLIIGMSLKTKPEEIYRALLEATAFGTRKIVDAFTENGLEVNEIYVCGGLPHKNQLLMQIYADVTNRVIKVADSYQTPALGAAMFGALAAGSANGGFDSILDATKNMARIKDQFIVPIPENVQVYEKLYSEYSDLHDYFGRGENNMMKRLRAIRSAAKIEKVLI